MTAPRHERLARDLANMLAVTVGNGDPVEPAIGRMAERLAQYEGVVEQQARADARQQARTADREQLIAAVDGLTVAVRTGASRQAAVRSGTLTAGAVAQVVDAVLGVTR